jgi:radical SAM superfamily enzyme YgiQ (UPF0313 family)
MEGHSQPLGVMCLSSYLKKHLGANTHIIDLRFALDPRRTVVEAVRGFNPELVCVSALTSEAFVMHEAARFVRLVRPEVPIFVGGPHATSDPEDVLANPAVDVAVQGEGEETLRELAEIVASGGARWRHRGRLSGVLGISFRTADGRPRATPPRPFIEDLDTLPFPDRDALDLRPYWRIGGMASIGNRPYATVFTSRGCPYRCTYCHNIFGRRFRARSADSVLAEVEEITRRYGCIDLEFVDDIANLRGERLRALFEGLLARGLRPRISFPNGVRADLLDRELIELHARVGAGEVSIAVETASPRLQRLIGKNLDLEKVRINTELMVRNGIYTRGFFMLGFPSETLPELLSTIRFALASPLHMALFFQVNPFHGLPITSEYARLGKSPAVNREYFAGRFNGSNVPDVLFRTLYRYAYCRFYFHPSRMLRILRDRPYKADIPASAVHLLRATLSFRDRDERAILESLPRLDLEPRRIGAPVDSSAMSE